jgi:hypothetical protein
MISEKDVAKGFQSTWLELAPLLTPQYVHLFNESYRSKIVSPDGTLGVEVPTADGPMDSSLIAEIAFRTAEESISQGLDLKKIAEEKILPKTAVSKANTAINRYRGTPGGEQIDPTAEDLIEICQLLNNYYHFFSKHTESVINFSPLVFGYGAIDSCEADLSIDETLYEAKTVTRNISSRDIKQLLVYLALQSATGDRRWSHGGFLNPRLGVLYRFEIDKVIHHISGGRRSSFVFDAILEAFSKYDIQIENTF